MTMPPSSTPPSDNLKALLYRIDTLEVKISFMDDTLEQLNQVITEQNLLMDAMRQQLRSMHVRLTELAGSNDTPAFDAQSERPPHF
jgi:SlyX protein